MGSRPDRQMLKDLAALGLESGGVTLLPFFIHVSSIKNLNIEYQEINEAGLKIDSELLPIVPSFPWHGIFALSAAVSPALYRRLQTWKYEYAKRNPEESMGWVFHVR